MSPTVDLVELLGFGHRLTWFQSYQSLEYQHLQLYLKTHLLVTTAHPAQDSPETAEVLQAIWSDLQRQCQLNAGLGFSNVWEFIANAVDPAVTTPATVKIEINFAFMSLPYPDLSKDS